MITKQIKVSEKECGESDVIAFRSRFLFCGAHELMNWLRILFALMNTARYVHHHGDIATRYLSYYYNCYCILQLAKRMFISFTELMHSQGSRLNSMQPSIADSIALIAKIRM